MFGTRTERVGTCITEGMPVTNRIPKMILHRFAGNYTIFIVPFIRKRVIALRAFIFYLPNAFKEFFVTNQN
jgi:hypothetical protein